MQLTKIQHKKLDGLTPIARKPNKISNYEFMCAMFYIIKNNCRGRALSKNMEISTQFVQNFLSYHNCHNQK